MKFHSNPPNPSSIKIRCVITSVVPLDSTIIGGLVEKCRPLWNPQFFWNLFQSGILFQKLRSAFHSFRLRRLTVTDRISSNALLSACGVREKWRCGGMGWGLDGHATWQAIYIYTCLYNYIYTFIYYYINIYRYKI